MWLEGSRLTGLVLNFLSCSTLRSIDRGWVVVVCQSMDVEGLRKAVYVYFIFRAMRER